ncbi:MAG: hypothetical protein U5K69_06925 [Balneolaceae bacterium]|nr:hypothetical protein [Balneolaceae bacterium]
MHTRLNEEILKICCMMPVHLVLFSGLVFMIVIGGCKKVNEADSTGKEFRHIFNGETLEGWKGTQPTGERRMAS